MAPRIDKAKKAFEDFTGHKPKRVTRAQLDAADQAGWKLGQAVGVSYEATRDGETAKYYHEFKKSARPDLVSRDDGKQLYFTGGRYKVTDRGITDMPALFVVNPSKRRKASKTRSAPVAKARRRRRSSAKRRSAPRQVVVMRANPTKRRRRRSVGFRRNPIAARRRRSVRGLAAGGLSFGKMLMPAVGIGLGAVGAEIAMGYLPIPANLKTGVMRPITKGAVSIAGGMLISKVLKQKKLGEFFMLGGVIIAVHDFAKELIVKSAPSVPFGAYVGTSPGGTFGAYMNRPGLGYANAAQVGTPFNGVSSDGYAHGGPDFRA
jgi:hypothetical protein